MIVNNILNRSSDIISFSDIKISLLSNFDTLTSHPMCYQGHKWHHFLFNPIQQYFLDIKFSLHQWIIFQYVNTGKYCFILQILILALFTDVLLISILMLSIQNFILIYWYFQYFTVSVFYVLNYQLTAVIWACLLFNSIIAN